MSTTEPGQEVVRLNPQQELAKTIEGDYFREQIAKALPENVTVDRFQRALLTAVMQNPDVAKADHQSILLAAIRCAQDGLLPDGRQAAIAVFGGQATYMPMIGGLRHALGDYGWTLRTRVVYQGDEFDFTEEPAAIHHKPAPPSEGRGQLIYAYAIATHKDGRRMQRVAFPDEIAKRKAVAKSKNVWEKWPAEMWEKTAGHMLFDEIPLGVPDEERARIARIVAGWEQSPESAVAAIYGPDRATPQLSAGEQPAQAPPLEPEEDATPPASGGGQAGGSTDSFGVAAAGSSPTQDSSGKRAASQPAAAGGGPDGQAPGMGARTPEPTLTTEPDISFGVPDTVIDQAMQTPVASQQGKTIAQILEHPQADDWVRWALTESSTLDPDEQAALELVVRERRPDLWAEGTREAA